MGVLAVAGAWAGAALLGGLLIGAGLRAAGVATDDPPVPVGPDADEPGPPGDAEDVLA